MPRPAASGLRLKVPDPQEALFQHDPTAGSRLKREWEPGCQPDEVYDRALPAWRAGLRRYFVRRLREEKEWMAAWQVRVRTEGRDRYFYWTAVFGTHSFFTAFLPLLFWFGHPEKGRGLLNAVGMGIYISSFAKDLVCTPRPYSPPVVRLSMSTHAHEYGFPSSHSTNSVTIALFFAQWVLELRHVFGVWGVVAVFAVLNVYAVSIVAGRLYTGMHSIADIVGGSLMGVACWAIYYTTQDLLEGWAATASTTVPMIAIPVTLACVHFHPNPIDPCPCFEDAIAILSVMLGGMLGVWREHRSGAGMPQAWGFDIWSRGSVVGAVICAERLILGIGVLVLWRLLAKAVFLRTLPPVYRFVARSFDLPTRKGYQPATSYSQVPPTPIRPVPSFIHLADSQSPDGTPDISPESAVPPRMSWSASPLVSEDNLRRRVSVQLLEAKQAGAALPARSKEERGRRRRRTDAELKYDAEVLTKVGVYLGIGLWATSYSGNVFGVVERWALQFL